MRISPDRPSLQTAIDHIISACDAEFGICLRHVESGMEVLVNPDALYPLASVFKVPLLFETLAQVDEGRLSLDTRVELCLKDKLPPSGILTELDPGLQPTLHDLLMLMIIVSDNVATDLVLQQIGIERVNERLATWGLDAISVTMSVQGLFDSVLASGREGIPAVAAWREAIARGPLVDPLTGRLVEVMRALLVQQPDWEGRAGWRDRENNVASPRAMGQLLERLVRGELLSAESTRVALNILLRQQLNQRLPRYLPEVVPIAHKTGTFLQSRNDAGILYLPDGSHLVAVTFALLRRELLLADPKESVPYIDGVDSAMGLIARAAYDAFSSHS
jgi:beta-lactamase class A